MADAFKSWTADNLMTPATSAEAITASDDEFAATRGVHCNTSGDFTMEFVEGGSITLTLSGGLTYAYRIKKLTAGTGLVALR
ncbi:MAG: hypothetical protein AAF762_00280 [Pseudomonadota bacterium]